MIRRCITTCTLLLAAGLQPACQQKMADQPSVRLDEPSALYSDGRAARPPVPGTVARGHLRTDTAMFTGLKGRGAEASHVAALLVGVAANGDLLGVLGAANADARNAVDEFPIAVTRAVLEHGRNRYMIFCVVCHDPEGTGRGKIVERGYTQPPSYHIDRLRNAPVGHFFDVITNGYGSMPEYKQQIPPHDRWAIAAFVRALQLSRHFPKSELSESMRAEWRRQEQAGGQSQ